MNFIWNVWVKTVFSSTIITHPCPALIFYQNSKKIFRIEFRSNEKFLFLQDVLFDFRALIFVSHFHRWYRQRLFIIVYRSIRIRYQNYLYQFWTKIILRRVQSVHHINKWLSFPTMALQLARRISSTVFLRCLFKFRIVHRHPMNHRYQQAVVQNRWNSMMNIRHRFTKGTSW